MSKLNLDFIFAIQKIKKIVSVQLELTLRLARTLSLVRFQREVTFIAEVPQWRPLFMVSKTIEAQRVEAQNAETHAVSGL